MYNRDSSVFSCGALFLISILAGVATGLLYGFEVIANLTIPLWVIIGFAVLALIIMVIVLCASSGQYGWSRCLCHFANCLLIGIIGSILSALSALTLSAATAPVTLIIVVALSGMFFVMTILSLVNLIVCAVHDRRNIG